MKYEPPVFDVIELNEVDIIKTSTPTTGNPDETPFQPASTSLDNNVN